MPTVPPSTPQHLLQLEGLSAAELTAFVVRAIDLREQPDPGPKNGPLAGRAMANLFFEDSTRTRLSFTRAAQRLGIHVLDLYASSSSVSKGETLLDTARNVNAMGVDAIVIRCTPSGGAALLAEHLDCSIINAGDGKHEHPTQGLLDLMTLLEHFAEGPVPSGHELQGKRIAIVGDIDSSRVARSNIHGLTTMGANVVLVGPSQLVPETLLHLPRPSGGASGGVEITNDLDAVLSDLDAIMMLRVQFERHENDVIGADYPEQFGLTPARAAKLKPSAPVLHPGPVNRDFELSAAVADDQSRSLILQQVSNGVAVRMAVLEELLG
ncbi:MAG: aspartate carbamoyltransferase catalytic subunit [Phycisphaerales bacterium]|nr:aspartate carbamoyltransferase catalytic subunit [Phycisphaerales bacterium]